MTEINVGGVAVEVEVPYYQFDDSDTTSFMPYTCPDVDYTTECTQDIIDEAIAEFKEQFIEFIEDFIERNRVVDKTYYRYSKATAEELIENLRYELESGIGEQLDGIGGNAADFCNGEIKERVTYEWRVQSGNMMDHAYMMGAESGIEAANEAISELTVTTPDEKELKKLQDEIDDYEFWAQWNVDMGNAMPELVGKFAGESPRTLDMFDMVRDGFATSEMWWGTSSRKNIPNSPDIVWPGERELGAVDTLDNIRAKNNAAWLKTSCVSGRWLNKNMRRSLPTFSMAKFGYGRFSIDGVVITGNKDYDDRIEVWVTNEKPHVNRKYELVWRK